MQVEGHAPHSAPLGIGNLQILESQYGEKVAALLLRVVSRSPISELATGDSVCAMIGDDRGSGRGAIVAKPLVRHKQSGGDAR